MYCRRCYAPLMSDALQCENCGRKFDLENENTFLRRPFPKRERIIGHIVFTTILGVVSAFAVAFHQMAATSGH